MNVYCSDIVNESYRYSNIDVLFEEVTNMNKVLEYDNLTDIIHEGVISNIFAKIKAIIKKIIDTIRGLFDKTVKVEKVMENRKKKGNYRTLTEDYIPKLKKKNIITLDEKLSAKLNYCMDHFYKTDFYTIDLMQLLNDVDGTRFIHYIDNYIKEIDQCFIELKNIKDDNEIDQIVFKYKDTIDQPLNISVDQLFNDHDIGLFVCSSLLTDKRENGGKDAIDKYVKEHQSIPNFDTMNDLDKIITLTECIDDNKLAKPIEKIKSLCSNCEKVYKNFDSMYDKWKNIFKQIENKGLKDSSLSMLSDITHVISRLFYSCFLYNSVLNNVSMGISDITYKNPIISGTLIHIVETILGLELYIPGIDDVIDREIYGIK